MLHKILTTALLISTLNCMAQEPANKTATPKDEKAAIDYHDIGAPMPTLKMVTLDTLTKEYNGKDLKKITKKLTKKLGYTPATRILTNEDVTSRGNVFMMMFNPTCGHCEDQTELLKKNIGEFKESRIYMLANATMTTYLPDFVRNHKTRDFYPTITVGLDSANFIKETFLYGALPQICIYSSDHKLLKSFNGEIPMDSLKKYID